MNIKRAIYIKLGRNGIWEKDSIENSKIRFGWRNIPNDLIISDEWDKIKEIIDLEYISKSKSTSTNDFNALKKIIKSDDESIFITFYSGKMYWCKPKVNSLNTDSVSKYLETKEKWSCFDINGDRFFEINKISGRISKYQLFKGTACTVGNKKHEYDYLCDIIEGKTSEEYQTLSDAKQKLHIALIPAIKNLVPKDFEILIDLIFRYSGYIRTSVLGEVMKFVDILLEEPFTHSLIGVQVKSESSFVTYANYKEEFLESYSGEIMTLFFAVHSPDKKLLEFKEENEKIKLMKVDEISGHAIDAGLINWILEKSR